MDEKKINTYDYVNIQSYNNTNFLTPNLENFVKKYELFITNDQNKVYNINHFACHQKINYVLNFLMAFIDISKINKINTYPSIPISKTVFTEPIVPATLSDDFLNLTRLDQYKLVTYTNNLVKELCYFIPEYQTYSYFKSLLSNIASSVLVSTGTIYYKLDNNVYIKYSGPTSYNVTLGLF